MQVEYICSRPSLVHVANWTDNMIDNGTIGVLNVGPNIDPERTKEVTVGSTVYTRFDATLFEALAARFQMWKADLHFKISVVRTAFHVGRIEVIFVPGRYTGQTSVDMTNTWRHIMDITEENELEFIVPYQHAKVMLRTALTYNQPTSWPGEEQNVGTLLIRALTPLTHPDTVSNTIPVMVWKWATNVALACPLTSGLETVTNTTQVTLQSDTMPEASVSGDGVTKTTPTIVTEGSEDEGEFEDVFCDLQINIQNAPKSTKQLAFGTQNSKQSVVEDCTVVSGECLINLRQATRGHRKSFFEVKDKTVLNVHVNHNMGGFMGLCSDIFAFYRGGISYKLLPQDRAKPYTIRSNLCRLKGTEVFGLGFGPEHTTYTDLNPFHEIQVPYYVCSRRALTNDRSTNDGTVSTTLCPGVYIHTDAVALDTYVGAKDDFTCGFVIGPPIYQRYLKPAL